MCPTKGAPDPFDIHGSSAPIGTGPMLGSIVYLIWILLLNIETKLKLKQDSSTLAFPIPRQTTLLFKYKWKRIKIYFTINSLIISNNPINPRIVFSYVDRMIKNLIFFSFFLQWKSSVLTFYQRFPSVYSICPYLYCMTWTF